MVDSRERRCKGLDLIEIEFNKRHPKILSLGEAADCSRDFERRIFLQGFHHAATYLAGGSGD